jgi:peptide deformylase
LQIIQVGEEVLRVPARELSRQEILSEETRDLIEHMRQTMRHAPGVGLAAPQVGISLQLAVIEDREEYHKKLTSEHLAERQRQPVPFHIIINPRIVSSDSTSGEFFEGCLSVAGSSAIVPRAGAVTVEYINERGETKRVHAIGWYARILQPRNRSSCGNTVCGSNEVPYVDHTGQSGTNLERHSHTRGAGEAEVEWSRLRKRF